jgi:hypothetical protein
MLNCITDPTGADASTSESNGINRFSEMEVAFLATSFSNAGDSSVDKNIIVVAGEAHQKNEDRPHPMSALLEYHHEKMTMITTRHTTPKPSYRASSTRTGVAGVALSFPLKVSDGFTEQPNKK